MRGGEFRAFAVRENRKMLGLFLPQKKREREREIFLAFSRKRALSGSGVDGNHAESCAKTKKRRRRRLRWLGGAYKNGGAFFAVA